MSKKYLIGVDGGSQSSKVVIFDLDGNIVCEGRQELRPLYMPEPGVVEHPDDDLWDSIVAACRQAMSRFPGDTKDIVALGSGSIRCCRAMLKEDGTLASPVLSWMDTRLARPYEHLDPEVRYVTAATGYINHRFTGVRKEDVANLWGQWPVDDQTWAWSTDPEAYRKYNLPRKMLFDLAMPGEVIGPLTAEVSKATGIPAGIPVVATANDQAVGPLGAGLIDEKSILVSLGTYIPSCVKGRTYRGDAKSYFMNMACVPHEYLYESGGIRRGMWTVSWFRNLFGDEIAAKAAALGISVEAYLEGEAREVPAGSDGLLTVLDWLAPVSEPHRKGAMIGFDGRHTRAHMYRSILEAIALTMKNHSEAMLAEMGMAPDRLIVIGGGSKSDLFMQIFADAYNLPAERMAVSDAAGLGAAICAAVGAGVYPDFETAVARMVRVAKVFKPIPEHVAVYDRINTAVYQGLRDRLEPVLRDSYPLFH